MNQVPTSRSWASTLLGAALMILFASIALSWSLTILQTMAKPLTIIIGLASLCWLVVVVRRRVRRENW